ncbi:MAG: type II secretion system protein [Sedimentisphaerales bacterium]|jgi:prepilin-type N-terminal cleavage/methylation domain-containing protein
MKPGSLKSGFTLIEMLMVVAIIAILVSMVVGVTKRIDDQRKERLCRSTIAIIGNALEQFRDFRYEYKSTDYAGLTFPLDCNGYDPMTSAFTYNLRDTLHNALYSSNSLDPPNITISPVAQHDPSYSGSEALYYILSQVPDCRTTLEKIDKSLLTNKGIDKVTDITITITSATMTMTNPFTRIIDPWGKTLRYDYYPDYNDYTGTLIPYKDYRDSAKRTFPVITSAGPDGKFDTADDISNVK